MKQRDNIHFSSRKIDSYNLPFNFIISEREAGKSTAVWLDKSYKAFKENGETTFVEVDDDNEYEYVVSLMEKIESSESNV